MNVSPMYFSLSTRVLLSVVDDACAHNLPQKGAPSYNAFTPSISQVASFRVTRQPQANVPVAREKAGQRPFSVCPKCAAIVLPDRLDGRPPTVIERPSYMGGVAPSERNSGGQWRSRSTACAPERYRAQWGCSQRYRPQTGGTETEALLGRKT